MTDMDGDLVINVVNDNTIKENYKLKILVVGESGVGKTNLIRRFANDEFNQDTKATVGVEFLCKTYKINQDIIKMDIWDTAGQERYRSITSAYYKGSKGVLIVYDITSKNSFDKIEKWLSEVKEKAGNDIKFIIIGNKVDLSEKREVTLKEATEKAMTLNCPLMETSALNSTNVQKAFRDLLIQIYVDFKLKGDMDSKEKKKKNDGVQLDVNNEGNKDEKGFCC